MVRKLAFLHSPELDKGGYPSECPFNSKRAGMTRQTVASMGLLDGAGRSEVLPEKASREALEEFHAPEYLDMLLKVEKGEPDVNMFSMGLGTPDTPVFRGMYDYVSLACGASLAGAGLILTGDADTVFNPSGGFHHAGPAYASGFCYMNDIVLAAMALSDAGRRVLFLDVDVHHCDGVQSAFYNRDDILTLSLHESGKTLFPGTGAENETGEGQGKGYSVNIPLPVGTYDEAYFAAFNDAALPVMKAYNPDVFMLQIGMDGLTGDPLAHLHLTNNVYADIIKEVLSFDKPVLVTGGGGYNIDNTVRGWALAWQVMCGEDSHDDGIGLGMGGVMLENADWAGGLRDRAFISDAGQRQEVDKAVKETIRMVQAETFSYHGI